MKICLACNTASAGQSWTCPTCGYTPVRVGGHLTFSPDLARSGSGFKAEHFAKLARLEADNFWFRSRNRLLIWALRRYFPDSTSLFEIGCGTGFVLAGLRTAFPTHSFSGSEIFTEGLEYAAVRLPGVELFQMDACKIPFAEEFDVVGAFDVLEHIAPDEEALAQMYRAVRLGGGILITVPQHMFLWSQADEEAMHQRRYAAAELRRKVERAGFTVVRMTSFVTIPFPLMAAQRLSRRRPDPNYSVFSELAIGGTLNRLLEGALTLERGLISSGLSLPLGGSLLLVARKAAGAHSGGAYAGAV